MEEAEHLCDRVAIVDHGKIVALDTPQNLINSLGEENRVIFDNIGNLPLKKSYELPGVSRVEKIGQQIVVYGSENPGKIT